MTDGRAPLSKEESLRLGVGAKYLYVLTKDSVERLAFDSDGTYKERSTLSVALPAPLTQRVGVVEKPFGNIAVGPEETGGTSQDRIYVANGAEVRKYKQDGTTDDSFTIVRASSIGTGDFNPSGEKLGTILDIGVEGNYLYVLGRNGAERDVPARVHVFNTKGEWLYSLTSFEDNRMKFARNISAASAGNGGGNVGEGRVFVATSRISRRASCSTCADKPAPSRRKA